MSTIAKVRVGRRAPDFRCDAIEKGTIRKVALSDYICEKKKRWLIILFIPAAFSFVCPTEVLAFQNCLDEFHDRKCEVVFVSVDSKHTLWHWSNLPREYGGLGCVDITLLSDATHKMGKDYGVFIEEEGMCLRGMFIVDAEGIVQHITINNTTVGRSILECLRLLEAFQAVAKHGVLCPVDWRPSPDAARDESVPNTLTESYDGRLTKLAKLQNEFGNIPVTDLDVKHNVSGTPDTTEEQHPDTKNGQHRAEPTHETLTISLHPSGKKAQLEVPQSNSAPASTSVTPVGTPTTPVPPLPKIGSSGTARHSRGHSSSSLPPFRPTLGKFGNSPHNTYESRRGAHVVLEFADPTAGTSSPEFSQNSSPAASSPAASRHASSRSVTTSLRFSRITPTPTSSPQPMIVAEGSGSRHSDMAPTRLQMTVDAIKKISGMGSPRSDVTSTKDKGHRKEGCTSQCASLCEEHEEEELDGSRGYFDVVEGEEENAGEARPCQ